MTAKLLAKASLSSTTSSSRLQSHQNEFPLPPCDPGRSGQFRQCFDTKQDRRNHHHRLLVSLFNEPLCSSEPIGFWSLVKLESFLQSSSNPCFKDYFRCADGKQSIFSCFVCDVQVDCQDGSDEKLSLCRPPKPKENDPLPEGGQYDSLDDLYLLLCRYASLRLNLSPSLSSPAFSFWKYTKHLKYPNDTFFRSHLRRRAYKRMTRESEGEEISLQDLRLSGGADIRASGRTATSSPC